MQQAMTQAGAVKSLHFLWNSWIGMKLHKYSEAQLREAVKNSTSMRQVLQKLDVAPYGGNYDVLRKAIAHYHLETTRFT
jgi:hypothetical protein